MKIILLFVFSALSLTSNAQQDAKKDFTPPMFMRGIGISFQKFDGLNSRIANRPEYKQLRDYAGTLDMGWMTVNKRFVQVMDLTLGSSMSGDREKKSSTIRYAGAGLDFGYDVIKKDMIMLYPMIGIGAQGYQARFFRDNSSVLFTDVLTSPTVQNNIRPVAFTNFFLTYRLGLGFAVKSAKYPSSSMGVKLGYTGSFKDKAWKSSDNQTLAGAPTDGLSQFSASLLFTSMPHFMRKK